jgi:lipopolysaccharide transport system ATP-binding protein
MSAVARENRTVLFVSHNMGAISALTTKCILLDRARMVDFGDTEPVIHKYLAMALAARATAFRSHDLELFRVYKTEDQQAKIIDIQISAGNVDVSVLPQIPFGSILVLCIQLDVFRTMQAADVGIVITNENGWKITELARSDYGLGFVLEPGKCTVMVTVGDLPLSPGRYSVDAWVIPILGVEPACDAISDYPLFSIVKEDHIDHYNPPIAWGAVHCRKVDWNMRHEDKVDSGD